MPTLDFSDVLDSFEFSDVISVLTMRKRIGDDGFSAPIARMLTPDVSAIVVPGKSNLRRLEDGTRVEAYIEVFTAFPLSTGGRYNDATERVADIVTWHGRQYTVVAVEDFSAFGAGFIKASCDLQQLNPSAT